MIRIKKLREERGMQQKELALDLGVSQPTISDWEAGRKIPAGKRLEQIADYFNVSVDYLIGRSRFIDDEHEGVAYAEAYGPVLDHFNGDIEKYWEFKKVEAEDAISKDPASDAPKLDDLSFALAGEVKDLTDEQKKSVLAFAKLLKEQDKK